MRFLLDLVYLVACILLSPWIVYRLCTAGRRDFALPSVEVPVVFFRRRGERVEMQATLDTVLFEPDAERFSMVWRASLALERDIFEVPQAVVGHVSFAWHRARSLGSVPLLHRDAPPHHDVLAEQA